MYIDIRQRLQLASGDSKFSPDQEDAIGFVTTTSRKAAIMVRRGEGRGGEGRDSHYGEVGDHLIFTYVPLTLSHPHILTFSPSHTPVGAS